MRRERLPAQSSMHGGKGGQGWRHACRQEGLPLGPPGVGAACRWRGGGSGRGKVGKGHGEQRCALFGNLGVHCLLLRVLRGKRRKRRSSKWRRCVRASVWPSYRRVRTDKMAWGQADVSRHTQCDEREGKGRGAAGFAGGGQKLSCCLVPPRRLARGESGRAWQPPPLPRVHAFRSCQWRPWRRDRCVCVCVCVCVRVCVCMHAGIHTYIPSHITCTSVDRGNVDREQRAHWLQAAFECRVPSSGVVAVVLTEAVSTCKQRVMSRKNHPTLPPLQSSLGIVDGMRRAWQVGVCVSSWGIKSGVPGDLLVFQVQRLGRRV